MTEQEQTPRFNGVNDPEWQKAKQIFVEKLNALVKEIFSPEGEFLFSFVIKSRLNENAAICGNACVHVSADLLLDAYMTMAEKAENTNPDVCEGKFAEMKKKKENPN